MSSQNASIQLSRVQQSSNSRKTTPWALSIRMRGRRTQKSSRPIGTSLIRRRSLIPPVYALDNLLDPEETDILLSSVVGRCWHEYEHAQIGIRNVMIGEVRPVVLIVEQARLERIEGLLAGYELAGIKPFLPALVETKYNHRNNLRFRLLVPPVIEYSTDQKEFVDGRNELVDGAHRLYTLRQKGQMRARALVVEACAGSSFSPAAGEPGEWDRLEVVRKKKSPRKDRFQGYDADLFRPVGKYLAGDSLRFASVKDFLEKAAYLTRTPASANPL